MKRIKKPLILLLALCLISGTAILPARADHTHAYDGPWVTDLEPSCTAAGRRYTVCTAADCTVPPYTLTDALPALGHNWGAWGAGTPAGCLTTGTSVRICGRCGAGESTPTPALGHNWGAWAVATAPGCTTGGTTQRICSRCGALETQSQAALGHNWSGWSISVAATCTHPGITERTCSRCGLRDPQATAALGHLWGPYTEVLAPSCTVSGVKERICAQCSITQTQALPALGHNWSAYTTTVAPTCNTKGRDERICSVCSLMQWRELGRLSHIYGAWTVVTPAACGVKGQEKRVCTLCGKAETRSIKALKHVSDENWVIVKTATLGSRGTQATHCTVCGGQARTRSYAPRGYTYDVPFYAYGTLAGNDVPAALASLTGRLIYVDMALEGVSRAPLVTEDNYMIGEAVITVAGGALSVSVEEASEPTRMRDILWHAFGSLEDLSANAFMGSGQPVGRWLPVSSPNCVISLSGIANYYKGNENKPFNPLL